MKILLIIIFIFIPILLQSYIEITQAKFYIKSQNVIANKNFKIKIKIKGITDLNIEDSQLILYPKIFNEKNIKIVNIQVDHSMEKELQTVTKKLAFVFILTYTLNIQNVGITTIPQIKLSFKDRQVFFNTTKIVVRVYKSYISYYRYQILVFLIIFIIILILSINTFKFPHKKEKILELKVFNKYQKIKNRKNFKDKLIKLLNAYILNNKKIVITDNIKKLIFKINNLNSNQSEIYNNLVVEDFKTILLSIQNQKIKEKYGKEKRRFFKEK